MYKKLNNYGYSLAETLLALVLVMIFVALTASIFTQKKSATKAAVHGKYECFKNSSGWLNQKLYDENGNLSSESENIGECEFVVPEDADMFSVEVIGGGGGGSSAFDGGLLNKGYEVLNGSVDVGCSRTISNKLSPYINDDGFNKSVLNGSYVVEISGGTSGRDPSQPVYCIYNANFKAKDKITCTAKSQGSGASYAEFKVTNPDFSDVRYSISDVGTSCVASNGNRGNYLLSETFGGTFGSSGVYVSRNGYSGSASSLSPTYKLSVSAHNVVPGGGGKHGDYIKRTINKTALSGTVVIAKNNIGDFGAGGKVNGSLGSNGGATVFSAIQPSIKASGGIGGINNINNAKILRNGPDDIRNPIPVVNGENGELIEDILTAEELKVGKFYVQGGVGNNVGFVTEGELNGKNAQNTAFGAGGGGGAAAFARNISNYGKCLSANNNLYLNNCGSINGASIGGKITAGKGGNGGGGAIIIRW